MLGDINGLPQEAARKEDEKAMNLTAANKGLQVNIALTITVEWK